MKLFHKQWRMCAIAFLSLLNTNLFSQKQDYVWLSGYDSHLGYDSSWVFFFGTSVIDFKDSIPNISYDSLKMNFNKTNTSYSDSNGNLLFYTNGIYVANSFDETIDNSTDLNWGAFIVNIDPGIMTGGYRTPQGIFALSSLSNLNQYYIFHTFIDTITPGGIITNKLLYTLLDMSLNNGHGKVLQKNIPVFQSNLGWEMAVTRHANGRDWWMILQKRTSNCYYFVLLDQSGPHLIPNLSCGGSIIPFGDVGSFAISPDGSKLAYFSIEGGINIHDLDRCNGVISNSITIPLYGLKDSGWIANGAAISPNGQFLYIGATKYVFQYDLSATDIAASVDTVATYDGFQSPFGAYYHTMQVAPNGKIYESCGNGETVYHVINRPDERGDSCLFGQHEIHLPSPSIGIPNFPNYRLGALTGSPCDTLTGLNETTRAEKERVLKVYPNPATDFITIDYGFTDWNKGEAELEITNTLGQTVYRQKLPLYSGFQKINVAQLPNSVYSAFIKRGNQIIAAKQFTKQ